MLYPEIHDFFQIVDRHANGAPLGETITALVTLLIIAFVIHKLREL